MMFHDRTAKHFLEVQNGAFKNSKADLQFNTRWAPSWNNSIGAHILRGGVQIPNKPPALHRKTAMDHGSFSYQLLIVIEFRPPLLVTFALGHGYTQTWICWWWFFIFFTDSTMINHHQIPPFGRIYFWFTCFHPHRVKSQIQDSSHLPVAQLHWAMKKTLVGWVIQGIIPPSYIGIIINHYKDPY